MDWDDEEFEPPPPVTENAVAVSSTTPNKWQDEDQESEEVPEVWDEEPPKIEDKVKKNNDTKKVKNKVTKPAVSEQTEVQTDPVAEKLKQQLKVEDADFENTQEIFSGLDSVSVINIADPKDEKDFEALSDRLARQLIIYEKSFHYRGFLKSLFKLTTQPLKSEEIKELAGVLTVVANEKLKSEKGKKKKGVTVKKTTLNLKDDDMGRGDDFDAYTDFM